jgi:hypothetical protein
MPVLKVASHIHGPMPSLPLYPSYNSKTCANHSGTYTPTVDALALF